MTSTCPSIMHRLCVSRVEKGGVGGAKEQNPTPYLETLIRFDIFSYTTDPRPFLTGFHLCVGDFTSPIHDVQRTDLQKA